MPCRLNGKDSSAIEMTADFDDCMKLVTDDVTNDSPELNPKHVHFWLFISQRMDRIRSGHF